MATSPKERLSAKVMNILVDSDLTPYVKEAVQAKVEHDLDQALDDFMFELVDKQIRKVMKEVTESKTFKDKIRAGVKSRALKAITTSRVYVELDTST